MTILRFLNPIEDQCDAAAQQSSTHDGGEQFNEFQFPHGPLSLHHFPDAALHQDDGKRHRRSHDKPPKKDFR